MQHLDILGAQNILAPRTRVSQTASPFRQADGPLYREEAAGSGRMCRLRARSLPYLKLAAVLLDEGPGKGEA